MCVFMPRENILIVYPTKGNFDNLFLQAKVVINPKMWITRVNYFLIVYKQIIELF